MLNAVISRFGSAVLSGVTLVLFASIMWLKLMSYVHVNYDMRSLSKSSDKGGSSFNFSKSYNVNIKSLAYFLVAPTLCYQVLYNGNITRF